MNRSQKLALLTQALQGNTSKLDAFKRVSRQRVFLFLVDETPKDWFGNPEASNTPVKAAYRLQDGTEVTDYLTYAQMGEKAKGAVLCILPDNGRRKRPTDNPKQS